MAITRTVAETYALATLGKAAGSTLLSAADLVDQAGRTMFLLRRWNFNIRGPVPLNLTKDQSYIDLPSDYATLKEFVIRDDTVRGFQFVDPMTLSQLRLQSTRATDGFVGAATYVTTASLTITDFTDLTFDADANTIVRAAGSWVTDGFAVGTRFHITGSTLSAHDKGYEVTTVTALTLTVTSVTADGLNDAAGTLTYITTDTAGQPTQRIELYPTPSTNQTGILHVWYRADWKTSATGGDSINIPTWVEPVFYACLDETVRGLQEQEVAPLWQRLQGLRKSEFFEQAEFTDSSIRSDFGPIENGMAASTRPGDPYRYPTSAAGAP
jgi:hypothetical protein